MPTIARARPRRLGVSAAAPVTERDAVRRGIRGLMTPVVQLPPPVRVSRHGRPLASASDLRYAIAQLLESVCSGWEETEEEGEVMTTEHAFRDRRRRSRTKLYRRALAGLGVLVLAQGLAACGGGGESSSTATGSTAAGGGPKGVLTIGVSSGGSVDPVANIGGNCTVVASGNCELWNESIVHRDPSARLVPGLATRWGFVGSGNRVFEVVVRQGARFSDGEPVTAEAMKTWINYYYNAPGAIQRGQLGTISSIETPDRWTVRSNMARPNPAIPFAMLAP